MVNGLNEDDVEEILMSLLSSSSFPSTDKDAGHNNERNRGGEKTTGKDEGTGTDYVSERTMDILLREMRKLDRDRDRVLHPGQVKSLFAKYKVSTVIP